MDKVVITPPTLTLNTIGSIANFSAEVLDPRGQPFPGTALVWSVADGAIAEATAPGKYRAKAAGKTTVTASVAGTPNLRGTAQLIVDQKIVKLGITPNAALIEALNGTFTFTGSARDANDTEIPNPGFKWTSSAPGVATIDQNGVATAHTSGRAVITLEAGGLSATADLDVVQKVVSIQVMPASHEFLALNDKKQFTAVARDANNQIVDRAVTWGTSNSGVVQVDALGNATAIGNGTATLSAQLDGVSGSSAITVRQVLVEILLNATSITLQRERDTFSLIVLPVDANKSEIKGLTPVITSSDNTVAVVQGSTIIALNKGSATITVSVGALTVTVPVTVVQGEDAAGELK
jgi:uncharacterized protein YjdB